MVKFGDFNGKNIFFIGIGGISMSALAMFSEKFGATVSGSDMSESAETRKLQQLGVDIKIGHDASNITTTIDYVIYTAAIPLNNVELIKANELKNLQTDKVKIKKPASECTKKYMTEPVIF